MLKSVQVSEFTYIFYGNNVPFVHSALKEQCHISRIFFFFFLAFLQTSYGFSLIKTYKLHYFYLILYSETTDRGEITVTTTFTSGFDLCLFPCFKYIVYQINYFALIAKWYPSIFIILVLFFCPELSRFPPCSPSFEGHGQKLWTSLIF